MSKRQTRYVQSFHLSKKYFPRLSTAKDQVLLAGGIVDQADDTENFWTFRQHDPDLFQKRSFRHWHAGHGIRQITAIPKPEYKEWFAAHTVNQ